MLHACRTVVACDTHSRMHAVCVPRITRLNTFPHWFVQLVRPRFLCTYCESFHMHLLQIEDPPSNLPSRAEVSVVFG
jgi:hypothetical protein